MSTLAPLSSSLAKSGGSSRTRGGRLHREITCVFCGLTCDDVTVTAHGQSLCAVKNGCAHAVTQYAALPTTRIKARVANQEVELESAIATAAKLLHSARQPLFSGLGTDIDGGKAVLKLADRLGGYVDHMHSDAMLHNFQVVQDHGWMLTTLSEVRNRATLVLLIGNNALADHPRFLERITAKNPTLAGITQKERILIYLGARGRKSVAGFGKYIALPVPDNKLPNCVALLAAMVDERNPPLRLPNNKTNITLFKIAALLRQSANGVVVWNAARLRFKGVMPTVLMLCNLIKSLNKTTRFAGLPLAGGDGATSVALVSTWQTGFPFRLSFASGFPKYHPSHFSAESLLERQIADLHVFISTFSKKLPVKTSKIPEIIIGRADIKPPANAAVFIPAAIPGIDHAGQITRTDGVVTLPLSSLRSSFYPTVRDILERIEKRLPRC